MTKYNIRIANREYLVDFEETGKFSIGGKQYVYEFDSRNEKVHQCSIGNRQYNIHIHRIDETTFEAWVNNRRYELSVENDATRLIKEYSAGASLGGRGIIVRAPMPGIIRRIEVAEGSTVERGTGLIILEAMKMENEIRAEILGRVKKIEVGVDTVVEKNQPLMHIEQL